MSYLNNITQNFEALQSDLWHIGSGGGEGHFDQVRDACYEESMGGHAIQLGVWEADMFLTSGSPHYPTDVM